MINRQKTQTFSIEPVAHRACWPRGVGFKIAGLLAAKALGVESGTGLIFPIDFRILLLKLYILARYELKNTQQFDSRNRSICIYELLFTK